MINELFPEEKRRLEHIEAQLLELERGNASIQTSDVNLGLVEMSSRLDELDRLAQRENDRKKKDDFRRRIQHLRRAHSHICSSFESHLRRRENDHAHLQKQSLFAGARGGASDFASVDLEAAAESESLTRSSRMVDGYLQTGQETLLELMSQRERLKGVQRQVFDMLNYLGVSNSLLKTVERRDVVDKILVFAGMLFISLLLLAIWWFRRR